VFELFFAMLSLGTLGFGLVVLFARIFKVKNLLVEAQKIALPLAALITTTAMLGSLYFSEIVNYVPCRLCWYQRAAMYPHIAIVLASVGSAISTYHWFLERFPDLDAGVCDANLPCSIVWFENFGFVTLAFMAFTAFFTTIVLVTIRTNEK
jgi:disulfide bond formation protein DsbB